MKMQKKTAIIVAILAAPAFLAFITLFVIGFIAVKDSADKCTATMWGFVTDVDENRVYKNPTSYSATVTSDSVPDMEFRSIVTYHEYKVGDKVKIFYDPDDMKNYYIEYAEPVTNNIPKEIARTALIGLIVVPIIVIRRKRAAKKSKTPDGVNNSSSE
ncbi:hypothetical protein [Ruminococcus sp.]|uniref:hypothetical protein n=1 Tax=Ruminococcus sp. TaxID=41978 RepID=UPI00258D3D50|nr:hypothetical protein [Ruminococcus sp.]MCR5021598.1 hypothetical protein [Ruminococcus sp.]